MTETWERTAPADTGFDPRIMADSLRAQGQDEAAAQIGALLPDDPDRVCALTGKAALGYAFVPGTKLPVSHGRYEKPPTALQRWLGGERPTGRVKAVGNYDHIVLGRNDNGPAQGAEAVVAVLGLREPGAEVEFDYRTDGDAVEVVMRRKGAK